MTLNNTVLHLRPTGFRQSQQDGIGRIPTQRSFLIQLLIFGIIFGASIAAPAQGSFTRIYGPSDQAIPVPQFTMPTAQKDAGALGELQEFTKVVNASNWTGMQSTAMWTVGGNLQQAEIPSLMTISADGQFRLDIDSQNGATSLRISGVNEEILDADNKKHFLPPLSAMAGFFSLPKLFSPAILGTQVTVLDKGMTTISGQMLHRITVEEPFYSTNTPSISNTSVIDFYFDPSTHLLIKSAVMTQITSEDRERYLQVVTYSNYQNANGVLFPFSISQTTNGQQRWALLLDNVQALPSLNSSYFHF